MMNLADEKIWGLFEHGRWHWVRDVYSTLPGSSVTSHCGFTYQPTRRWVSYGLGEGAPPGASACKSCLRIWNKAYPTVEMPERWGYLHGVSSRGHFITEKRADGRVKLACTPTQWLVGFTLSETFPGDWKCKECLALIAPSPVPVEQDPFAGDLL